MYAETNYARQPLNLKWPKIVSRSWSCVSTMHSWEVDTDSRKESLAYILRTANTCNRALWPSGKAADLKSVPLTGTTDSKSVAVFGRRFESYQCHSFCLSACFHGLVYAKFLRETAFIHDIIRAPVRTCLNTTRVRTPVPTQ